MVVPAGGENDLGSDQDAFTGRFEINGERLKPHPVCHTDHTSQRGFSTTGVINYAEGRIRQSLAVVALEDGETSLVIDWTVANEDIDLLLNEGFGIYIMNDFINKNRVRISFEHGRRKINGVGGKPDIVETRSTWIKIAGCLGIETDGETIYYEDASERNTPERWKSLLQDRVFLRPEANNRTLRDFACVIRQGRSGTRRIGDGVERLPTEQQEVRAFRIQTRIGKAIANFSNTQATIDLVKQTIDLPAMDTVIVKE